MDMTSRKSLYVLLLCAAGVVLSSRGMELPSDIAGKTSDFAGGPPAAINPIDLILITSSDYGLLEQVVSRRINEILMSSAINEQTISKPIYNQNNVHTHDETFITPSLSVFTNTAMAFIPSTPSYAQLMLKMDDVKNGKWNLILAKKIAEEERLFTTKLEPRIEIDNLTIIRKIRFYDLYLLINRLRHTGDSLGLTNQDLETLQNILKPTHQAWQDTVKDQNSGYTEIMLALKYRKDNNIDQKDDIGRKYLIKTEKID